MLIEFRQVTGEDCSINPQLVASTEHVEIPEPDEDDDVEPCEYETGTLIILANGVEFVVAETHAEVVAALNAALDRSD